MGSGLLCCVALCLLGAGPLDAAVFQTPKYLVAQVGNAKSLRCEQKLSRDAMHWYKQDAQHGLQATFTYSNKKLIVNETVPSRFSPKSLDKAHLNLHVDSLEPGDSAVYSVPAAVTQPCKVTASLCTNPLPSQEAVGTAEVTPL
ncbi:T-cell receptor beta chain V region A20.2.25 [Pteropus alecto]|nr:T-cell receptor beta chain V region A20.2.25 [Pteropus alecto]